MNEFNQGIIKEFRENAGIVGGIFKSAPMILITHKGAKSGKTYVSPLVYSRDGDRYVIIASIGGARTHPDWYHNLVANPEITVEIGKEKFKARAKTTSATERERLFDAQAKMMPQFNSISTRRRPSARSRSSCSSESSDAAARPYFALPRRRSRAG